MPQAVIRDGLWARMRPGEQSLYIFLMHQSERYRTRVIAATDSQISQATGTASRTLCNARKKLQEHGLVQYRAGTGNKYVYTICDPSTRQPYPGDPRIPQRTGAKSEARAGPETVAHATAMPTPVSSSEEALAHEMWGSKNC